MNEISLQVYAFAKTFSLIHCGFQFAFLDISTQCKQCKLPVNGEHFKRMRVFLFAPLRSAEYKGRRFSDPPFSAG